MIHVHKYGGTILNRKDSFSIILDNCQKLIQKKDKLIIVVSAMGRLNDPYATDTFLLNAKYLPNKEYNQLITIGEVIAGLHLLNYLKQANINAKLLDYHEIGIKVNDSKIMLDAKHYKGYLLNYDVLIVPGFQGEDVFGNIVALPRGGSDLTAILIAHMLMVKKVKLYKDVPGIMTGDPKIIEGVKLIKKIDYQQASLLSSFGGKIIQSDAIEYAKKYSIEILILKFLDNNIGTIIKKNRLFSECFFINIVNDKIIMVGENINISYQELEAFFDSYQIELQGYKQAENYLEIVVEKEKNNIAMNLLHHKYIDTKHTLL